MRLNVRMESWVVRLYILASSASFNHFPVQKSTFIHNGLVCSVDSDSALGVANKEVYKTFHSKSTM